MANNITEAELADLEKPVDIAAIKAKRERQDATKAEWSRKYDGAKTAEEWTRDDFACFIKQAPQLDKLSTPELRALFLQYVYQPIHGEALYKRVQSLKVWKAIKASRGRVAPYLELAMSGEWDMAEAKKVTAIWNNL